MSSKLAEILIELRNAFRNPVYVAFLLICITLTSIVASSSGKPKAKPFNTKVKKDQPKVVDTVKCNEIESIVEYKDGKVVMCRSEHSRCPNI